jgi:hypothetical protein
VEVLGRDGAKAVIPVCKFGRGDCVWEMEFLYGHQRCTGGAGDECAASGGTAGGRTGAVRSSASYLWR